MKRIGENDKAEFLGVLNNVFISVRGNYKFAAVFYKILHGLLYGVAVSHSLAVVSGEFLDQRNVCHNENVRVGVKRLGLEPFHLSVAEHGGAVVLVNVIAICTVEHNDSDIVLGEICVLVIAFAVGYHNVAVLGAEL